MVGNALDTHATTYRNGGAVAYANPDAHTAAGGDGETIPHATADTNAPTHAHTAANGVNSHINADGVAKSHINANGVANSHINARAYGDALAPGDARGTRYTVRSSHRAVAVDPAGPLGNRRRTVTVTPETQVEGTPAVGLQAEVEAVERVNVVIQAINIMIKG